MTIQLWHCHNARSLRALWALEEMGLDYQLELLPFPPRFLKKEYLDINELGTVPFLKDGDTTMTESVGICHYLVERYGRYDFALKPDHKEYGDYLNWLYHSDATLTFPQAIYLRYAFLEPQDRQLPQAATDYAKWFIARLRKLDNHIKDRDYLCDNRFTIADIAIGYALHLGELLDLDKDYTPQVKSYLTRLQARPAFKRAVVKGEEDSIFNKLTST